MNVLLTEILAAREARAERQQALLREYQRPVVSFTMNIAGPVKTSPLILRAFEAGLSELEKALDGHILSREVIHAVTGDEAMLSVYMDANELKPICTAIEERYPMGRLFDMDVLDTHGHKLDRPSERCCLVCGKPGRGCASRRLHSVAELQEATRTLISSHFIADAAVEALIDEVRTTPKPGLVDLRNNGSHTDMDVPLFLASAEALRPYFTRCAAIGADFRRLREAGIEAEKTMYAATGGVNTHKGAIYTLGILCASCGWLMHTGETAPDPTKILLLGSFISADTAKNDLAQGAADTAGLRLYRELGIGGIREEMAKGLPSVEHIALPALRRAQARGLSRNDAGVYALLHLIANVQDTNLWHRGGAEGAEFARRSAQNLLNNRDFPTREEVEALDDAFIARNLSPGGCADLLAAAYFLDTLL